MMTSIGERAGRLWREFVGRVWTRRDKTSIDSVTKLQDFVATRSAYVAQKTLYGYVKARMGIRYPAMFENDALIASLNIAKLNVFAACLSDLTIHAVAIALHEKPLGDEARCELARRCFAAGLRGDPAETAEQFPPHDYVNEFQRRIETTDWRSRACQPENFTHSPAALVTWAPIADPLKRFDSEIIENSVKFAWRDIREQARQRIDAHAVFADWSQQMTN